MKRIAIALFAVAMGVGVMVQDTEAAKRLGGGKTSGVGRESSVMKRDAIPAKPAVAPGAAAPAANAASEAFSEVWYLTKPLDGSRGWSSAEIQQC